MAKPKSLCTGCNQPPQKYCRCEVYFSVDQTPEGSIQLSINGDSTGYRIFGPTYDGRSTTIARHKITRRDVEQIRAYLRRIPALAILSSHEIGKDQL